MYGDNRFIGPDIHVKPANHAEQADCWHEASCRPAVAPTSSDLPWAETVCSPGRRHACSLDQALLTTREVKRALRALLYHLIAAPWEGVLHQCVARPCCAAATAAT